MHMLRSKVLILTYSCSTNAYFVNVDRMRGIFTVFFTSTHPTPPVCGHHHEHAAASDHDWEDVMNTPRPAHNATEGETHCAVKLDEQTGKVVRKLMRSAEDEAKIQEFCKVCCEEKEDNKFIHSKETKFLFGGKKWRCHNHRHTTSWFKIARKVRYTTQGFDPF